VVCFSPTPGEQLGPLRVTAQAPPTSSLHHGACDVTGTPTLPVSVRGRSATCAWHSARPAATVRQSGARRPVCLHHAHAAMLQRWLCTRMAIVQPCCIGRQAVVATQYTCASRAAAARAMRHARCLLLLRMMRSDPPVRVFITRYLR
jgi:hypothetical protein